LRGRGEGGKEGEKGKREGNVTKNENTREMSPVSFSASQSEGREEERREEEEKKNGGTMSVPVTKKDSWQRVSTITHLFLCHFSA